MNIDVKCEDCGEIYEVFKKNIIDNYVLGSCPKCGSDNVRRIWSVGGTDIAKGNFGNSETGYGKEFTYHPSKYGKYKGKRIK